MKKLIAILTIMLFIILPSSVTQAKSYTIDEVQIKGWIHPNGDMLVNEIFKYTFDGKFSELTRSFPDRHNAQIEGFEAYILNKKKPVVGELTNDMLTQMDVATNGTTKTTKINTENKTFSVLYVYTMRGAVKSYETYSDSHITFFEGGKNHDTDMKNVTISYILPADVGDINVHGFMHDKSGRVDSVYRDGIILKTPKSQARSATATRVFYPSFIMTEQQKGKAPMSLEEAIAQETKRIDILASKVSLYQIMKPVFIAMTILFVVVASVLLLFRQRSFGLFGNANLVLEIDPVYLSFVDRNGVWHSRSFLAGVFSLIEKGGAQVKMEQAADRFRKHPDVAEKTFAFELTTSVQSLLSYEKKLIDWLFKSDLTERKFHLHDIAGMAKGQKANKKRYENQQYAFEQQHYSWHEEVEGLMRKAGIFSSRLSSVIQWGVLVVLFLSAMFAHYVAVSGSWEIAFPLIAFVIVLVPFMRHPGDLLRPIIFFALMLFSAYRIEDSDLKVVLFLLVLAGTLLYYATPTSIITSPKALYMKMSMNKFRSQVRSGLPQNLSEEEQNRWLTRAYLLNKSTEKLPQLNGPIPKTLPLAALFKMTTDPVYFVRSTWAPSFYYGPSIGGSSGGASDSGGGSSGGGDGGGAGAD